MRLSVKHLFIINPRAGKKNSTGKLMDQIEQLRKKYGLNCETMLTTRAGHAEEIARRAAQSGEETRIYACGGDGTINEVANGAAGAQNIEVTVVPVGTGNDFLKNFGEDRSRFLDLEQLWNGPSHPLDLIDCNGRIALTIACTGLDSRVADDVHSYSKYPGVTGKGAYLASLGVNFFKTISTRMTIIEDEHATIGEYILICVCNGRYYGGGFMPVPEARMDDGKLDMLVVKKVSRPTFLRAVSAFAKGEWRKYPQMIRYSQPENIRIQAKEPMPVSLDGEVIHTKDIQISLSEKKLRFFAPKGAHCNRTTRTLADDGL